MKREQVRFLLTEHKLLFPVIMERLKRALNLKNDSELGRELGMSTSNFSNRKTSNSIPFDVVVPFCLSKSISTDWLFSGEGDIFTNGEQSTTTPIVPVEPLLFGEIFADLEHAFKKSRDGANIQEADGLYLAAKKGMIAADIYNRVMLLKSPKGRSEAIAEHADQYAAFTCLMDRHESLKKKLSGE